MDQSAEVAAVPEGLVVDQSRGVPTEASEPGNAVDTKTVNATAMEGENRRSNVRDEDAKDDNAATRTYLAEEQAYLIDGYLNSSSSDLLNTDSDFFAVVDTLSNISDPQALANAESYRQAFNQGLSDNGLVGEAQLSEVECGLAICLVSVFAGENFEHRFLMPSENRPVVTAVINWVQSLGEGIFEYRYFIGISADRPGIAVDFETMRNWPNDPRDQ